MSVTDDELLGDLLYGSAQPLGGSKLGDEELIELAVHTFKEKPFCVVRHWMILDVMLPEFTEQEIKAQGLEATVLYAQSAVYDSQNRHSPSDSILSGYQGDFDGCIFESKTTIFILAGRGARKHVSLSAIQVLAMHSKRAQKSYD
ncbi:hypothetical protein CS078_15960 [Pseudomonas prosekii]|uniref:DUF6957 domain-containing protein n=1 Tax=Pseudomonas prosekii TaxID=1148509 RepID=A0A3L8CKU7_9PSED|nr:hypothetical protein [Pseudomonas prosekii]RLU08384.1 hypothetical protein CS078_15960 [Pseudomonas prosekii]RLU11888.1 hypothetical protein CS076_08930 [Pseudomonas prosekii]